jgi:hypothetical protein
MVEPKPLRLQLHRVKGRKPAILLVEDEVLLRVVIADYLRECGFKVTRPGTAPKQSRF